MGLITRHGNLGCPIQASRTAVFRLRLRCFSEGHMDNVPIIRSALKLHQPECTKTPQDQPCWGLTKIRGRCVLPPRSKPTRMMYELPRRTLGMWKWRMSKAAGNPQPKQPFRTLNNERPTFLVHVLATIAVCNSKRKSLRSTRTCAESCPPNAGNCSGQRYSSTTKQRNKWEMASCLRQSSRG